MMRARIRAGDAAAFAQAFDEHAGAVYRHAVRSDGSPDGAEDVVAAAALRRLRRTEREVFLLCVWSRLDYAAAAEALGIPIGTVRSRLSRARSRLRTLAAAEMEPRPVPGQVLGDRAALARPAQEEMR